VKASRLEHRDGLPQVSPRLRAVPEKRTDGREPVSQNECGFGVNGMSNRRNQEEMGGERGRIRTCDPCLKRAAEQRPAAHIQ
jgi:hypothetical protein